MESVNDIVVGRKNIRELFGGRHWTTILKMIEEEGYPISLVYGRWQCSRSQIEMWHRGLQEQRSQEWPPRDRVNP